jgi:hypothetical protein
MKHLLWAAQLFAGNYNVQRFLSKRGKGINENIFALD